MDYKIIDISSGQLEIRTTGAASNPDTILSTSTFTTDKSHTDEYYLVINASLEYAGQVGQVVVYSPVIMTAVYNENNYLTSISEPSIPDKEDILDAINTEAQNWIAHLNKKDLLRTYVESVRNTVDTYDYELKDSRYTKPFINLGAYDPLDPLADFTSQIGGNEDRRDK